MQQLLFGEKVMETGTGGLFDALSDEIGLIQLVLYALLLLIRDPASSPRLEIKCVVSISALWLSTLVIFRRLTFGCISTSPICAIKSNLRLSVNHS